MPIINNSYSIENKNKQFKNNEVVNFITENNYDMNDDSDDFPDMYAKLEKIEALNNKINPLMRFQKIKNNHIDDLSLLDNFLQDGKDFDKNQKNIEKEVIDKNAHNYNYNEYESHFIKNEDRQVYSQD